MRKTNIHFIGNGRRVTIPGLTVGQSTVSTVQRGDGRNIPAELVPVVSLRESNPDGPNPGVKYLRRSIENMAFMTDRFDSVVGLDVDEDGVVLTYQDLEARRANDIAAIQQNAAEGVEVTG